MPVALVLKSQPYTLADTALAWTLIQSGGVKQYMGKHNQSQADLERCVAIFSALGVVSARSAFAWELLAKSHYYQANYDQAIQAFVESGKQYRSIFPPLHAKVLQSDNDQAVAWSAKGDFRQALALQFKTLEAQEKIPDPCTSTIEETLNHIGVAYLYLGDYPKASTYLQRAEAAYWRCRDTAHIFIADLYVSLGACYGNMGRYYKNIEYLEKAIAIYTRLRKQALRYKGILNAYNNLAIAYGDVGNFLKSREYLEKSLGYRIKSYGPDHPEVLAAYINLGNFFSQTDDYGQALHYLGKAQDILVRRGMENQYYAAPAYSNMAIIYSEQGDPGKAVEYALRALDIYLNTTAMESGHITGTYHNLATYFYELGDFRQAAAYHERAIEGKRALSGDTLHPHLAIYYGVAGKTMLALQDDARAMAYHEKSIAIAQGHFPDGHPDLAAAHARMGDFYQKTGNIPLAREQYSRAAGIERRVFGTALLSTLLAIARLHLANGEFDLAEAVLDSIQDPFPPDPAQLPLSRLPLASERAKLHLLRHTSGQGQEWLYKAKAAYDGILYLLDEIPASARSYVPEDIGGAIGGAIATNWMLYNLTGHADYVQEAFSYAARSKAFQLNDAIKADKALKVAGIPDSLMAELLDLRRAIAFHEIKRQESLWSGTSPDSALLDSQRDYFGLRSRYDALNKQLETDFPAYRNARFNQDFPTADQVRQELIEPGQTLLEYVLTDSAIFAFVVNRDTLELFALARDFPLEQLVEDMTRNGIYGYYALPPAARNTLLEERARSNYVRSATQLYAKLIAPIAHRLTDTLLIIPDGVLGYIPFEALLKGQPGKASNFGTYPFLLYERQISYCYSTALLREMREKQYQKSPLGQLLAMAPFAPEQGSGLLPEPPANMPAPLPGSRAEAANAARTWNGVALFGKEANRERFFAEAGNYRILHLATHGMANDLYGDYAYLALSSNDSSAHARVYAKDLYTMALHSDLAVLSACETGTGKLRKGEGILSMARAFAYAGAKSILTTLWKVNDDRTRMLFAHFYQNLRQGLSKDAALTSAKLRYLQENRKQGNTGMHPFFWAALILTGDIRPIP